MSDFVNLTNGLDCCPDLRDPHFLRIQSTWCEQKLWADVLATVGPDFLYHLATESALTVHDYSERPRITRAVWQGVPWVRYACQRVWGIEPDPVLSRGGVNVTRYFLAHLPERLVKHVRYFGKFSDGSVAVITACDSRLRPALEAVS